MRSPAVFALSACFFGFSLLGFSTAHAQHSQQQGSQPSAVANAQAASTAANGAVIDAQFKANILKLLDLTHAMALGHDAAARMLQSLRPTLIAALPPTEHREQIADAYGDKLTALLTGQTMTDQLAGIYARHLSAEDVAAMIQFYQTAGGAAFAGVAAANHGGVAAAWGQCGAGEFAADFAGTVHGISGAAREGEVLSGGDGE